MVPAITTIPIQSKTVDCFKIFDDIRSYFLRMVGCRGRLIAPVIPRMALALGGGWHTRRLAPQGAINRPLRTSLQPHFIFHFHDCAPTFTRDCLVRQERYFAAGPARPLPPFSCR